LRETRPQTDPSQRRCELSGIVSSHSELCSSRNGNTQLCSIENGRPVFPVWVQRRDRRMEHARVVLIHRRANRHTVRAAGGGVAFAKEGSKPWSSPAAATKPRPPGRSPRSLQPLRWCCANSSKRESWLRRDDVRAPWWIPMQWRRSGGPRLDCCGGEQRPPRKAGRPMAVLLINRPPPTDCEEPSRHAEVRPPRVIGDGLEH